MARIASSQHATSDRLRFGRTEAFSPSIFMPRRADARAYWDVVRFGLFLSVKTIPPVIVRVQDKIVTENDDLLDFPPFLFA
jgi:hypothetical protein